jgi:hypothetical protein
MSRKIMTIGDVHGRDTWKFMTHGSSYEFEQWAIMVGNGADPNDELFKNDYPYTGFDKIIFIGDYVDSFDVDNIMMKKNLEDIILFKKALPHKVILLWGNHDVQYFIPDQICSGYRPEMKWDLQILFRDNRDLFQMAYQENDYLWTHAGLSKPVLKSMMRYDFLRGLKSEAEVLNDAFLREVPEIFAVDSSSGGCSMYGGPLWIRPNDLIRDGVDLHQIIGHTPQRCLKEFENRNSFRIVITDYIEYYDADEEIQPFILEIETSDQA